MVEVMVAIALLLVGVLGTVKLITGANAATNVDRHREAGLTLARQVTEAAKDIDYDSVSCASAAANCASTDAFVTTVQGLPGMADTTSGGDPWNVRRGGINFQVGPIRICKVDEARDGNADHDAGFCGGASTCSSGCGDSNPDDYRRVAVTITWTGTNRPATTQTVRQIALIQNPSGGLGPTVKSPTPCLVTTLTASACPGTTLTTIVGPGPTMQPNGAAQPACNGSTPGGFPPSSGECTTATPTCVTSPSTSPCAMVRVNTSSAQSVHWTLDDGSSSGNATPNSAGSSTNWMVGVPLGTVTFPTPTAGNCQQPSPSSGVLDGSYSVSVQGFDTFGAAGDLKSLTIRLNRYAPAQPCQPSGGYDGDSTRGNVLDFEWTANKERDIKGYVVFWTGPDGIVNGNDTAICGTVANPISATSCTDSNPDTDGTFPTPVDLTVQRSFYVAAIDQWGTQSDASPLRAFFVGIAAGITNQKPYDPSGAGSAVVGGQPQTSWSVDPAAYPTTNLDPDSGDSVIEYRIYRDGTAYSNRYATVRNPATTPSPATLAFTDIDPNWTTGSHSYYVSAVDSHYQESGLVGPFTP